MNAKQLKELNAWIEINVFGKQLFSEIRGEYEWFYFREPGKDNEKLKPRQWSEYDPMKHVLPDSQPRRFHDDNAAALQVLEKCAEHGEWPDFTKLMNIEPKGNWVWTGNEGKDYIAPTLPLAICLFAKALFIKQLL